MNVIETPPDVFVQPEFFYGEKVQGNFAIPFKCANVSWEEARAFTDMELEEQLFKKDKEPSI